MTKKWIPFVLAGLCLGALTFMTSCGDTKPKTEGADFDKLVDDFVYGSLALSPVGATGTGYHSHNGVSMDEALDDFSPAGIDAGRKFFTEFDKRLAALDQASLDKEQKADVGVIRNAIAFNMLDLPLPRHQSGRDKPRPLRCPKSKVN